MNNSLLTIKTQVIKINYHLILSHPRRSKDEGNNKI